MNAAKWLVTTAMIVMGYSINTCVNAAHEDLAPLGQETANKIRKATLIDKRSSASRALSMDLDQIESAVDEEISASALGVAKKSKKETSQTLKTLLDSKAIELKTSKDQVLREMDAQKAKLEGMGLAHLAKRIDAQKLLVEEKFVNIEEKINHVGRAQGAENKKAMEALREHVKTLGNLKQVDSSADPDKPITNYTAGRRRPPEERIQSPVVPAYVNPGTQAASSPLVSAQSVAVPVATAQAVAAPANPSCNTTAADLDKNTIEARVTPEIAVLAQKLNYSPVRIFEYVANNIRYEPYWGLLKGAQGTLVAGTGGAMDQAALLVALMRESNIPARYVRGTIGFYQHGQSNPGLRWLGVKSFEAAAELLLHNNTPNFAHLIIDANGTATGIEFSHAWAEVCVPYDNYRGTQADNSGARWIPLDASFKDNKYQPGRTHDVIFDYNGYMSKRSIALPHEAYAAQVEARSSYWSVEDVPYKATQQKNQYDILPASLPYYVLSYDAWDVSLTAETAVLPDIHRYKLIVDLKNSTDVPLMGAQSFWMSEIALKRLSLGWQGASSADQSLLDAWKNQSLATGLPCSTVSVKPELRLDGALLTVGSGAVDICTTANQLTMRIELGQGHGGAGPWLVSDGAWPNIGAANVYALHAHAYQTSDRLLKERAERLLADVQANPTLPNQAGDEILAEFLHLNLLKWMRYSSDAAKQVAELDRVYPGVGLHMGVTSSQMKIDYAFDLPFAVHRTGYLIDVRMFESFPLDLTTGAVSWKTFMLGGYAGSAYESYIWQETAGVDAISSVRGIQFARENGTEVLTLTEANWATESVKLTTNADPAMNYSAATVNYLYSTYIQPGLGFSVTLPRSLIQYQDWKGAVYIGEMARPGAISQKAEFIIDRYSGGLTIGDLMRAGDYGAQILDDLGFYVRDLWRRMDLWGYPATTSTAMRWDDLVAINSVYNTGLSQHTSNVGNTTTCNQASSSAAAFDNYVYGQDLFDGMWAGDPVNTVTGNMYLNQSDLFIKGRCGLHLTFERSYNSRMPKDGSLGFGWTHTYNHYLVFTDDNMNSVQDAGDTDGVTSSVAWVDSTGAVRQFKVTGNAAGVPIGSVIQADSGLYFRMERQSDGSYTIREKSGLTYKFENLPGLVNQTAKLAAISDRNSNTISMTYNVGKLATVTDSTARSLTFTYNGSGRISDMKDWAGRQFHYDYDAYGNLVTYQNPLAFKGQQPPTRYEYYADGAVDSNGMLAPRNHAMKRYVLPKGNGETFEYYMNGRVFKEYNALGETNTFTYNPYRRETVMTNTRGITRSFMFDPNGNPIKITAENGGVKSYTYDCLQPGTTNCANPFRKTGSTNAIGATKGYLYDGQGNVIQLTKPNWGTESYSDYNAFGVPGKIMDSNYNYTLFKFDAKGNVLEKIALKAGYGFDVNPAIYVPVASQIAQWSINTYDAYGNLRSTKRIKDAATQAGTTLTYSYDAKGLNVASITRAGVMGTGASGSDLASFTYDTLGRMKTGIDDDWQPIQKAYDDLDRVVQATDKLGNLRSYAYDENGNLLSEKIDTGVKLIVERSYTYDLADRKITETDSGGNITRFDYDAAGNIIKKTNPDGISVSYEYDDHDYLVKELDTKGNATTYQRDKNGNPVRITDSNGVLTTRQFNTDGKLTFKSKPGGLIASEYAYDLNGNLFYYWDEAFLPVAPNDYSAKVNWVQFDELNRPLRKVGPAVTIAGQVSHPVTRYTYDMLGNLAQVDMGSAPDATYYDPAADIVTTQFKYTWDDYGHRLTKTDGNGKTWNYRYDRYGNLTQSTDARNQAVFYSWGYGHQLACISKGVANVKCSVDANLLKKYTRDYLGQVVQAYSPNVTYSYNYDTSHRVSSVTDSRAGKSLTYSWSQGGLLDRLATNDGQIVDYQYDTLGRLIGIWAPNGDYVTLSWDAGGRMVEKWFPNGVNTQFAYNTDNTLKQVKNRWGYSDANLISQHDYGYDGFGNRMQQVENITGSTVTYNYAYDDLMRLLSVDNGTPAQLQSYGYDFLNNRTSQLTGDVAAPNQASYYQYDAANQLTAVRSASLTGPLTAAFVYDTNGNLTQQCQDGTVTGTTTACTGSTATATTFDALNRIAQVTRTGQATQLYAYDDQDRRIRKTVGSVANDYIYQGQDILAEYANGWTEPTGFITHGASIDIPLIWQPAANDPTGPRYFHQDGLNSVVATTTVAGQDATQRYDAWGNRLAGTGQIPLYGYTGREQDGLGYTYYRARYYDPSIGRFTQRDPIELEGGVNLYTYVGGNPVSFNDPAGLAGIYVDYPDYPITIPGTKTKLELGHAAVIAVDEKTGTTKYFEYGRYDSDFGQVKQRVVPNLVMSNGQPTQASLQNLYSYISTNYGKSGAVNPTYNTDSDYQKIVNYALKLQSDTGRESYSWNPLSPNTCKTFAGNAIDAGKGKAWWQFW